MEVARERLQGNHGGRLVSRGQQGHADRAGTTGGGPRDRRHERERPWVAGAVGWNAPSLDIRRRGDRRTIRTFPSVPRGRGKFRGFRIKSRGRGRGGGRDGIDSLIDVSGSFCVCGERGWAGLRGGIEGGAGVARRRSRVRTDGFEMVDGNRIQDSGTTLGGAPFREVAVELNPYFNRSFLPMSANRERFAIELQERVFRIVINLYFGEMKKATKAMTCECLLRTDRGARAWHGRSRVGFTTSRRARAYEVIGIAPRRDARLDSPRRGRVPLFSDAAGAGFATSTRDPRTRHRRRHDIDRPEESASATTGTTVCASARSFGPRCNS